MTITIMSDYLVFPVYTHSTNKKMVFQYEGETIDQLNIKLDNTNPDFYAYIDVSRFKGEDIEISVLPEMEISFREADAVDIDNLYREALRPQIHYTVKNGFLGKPKNLVYSDGVYHLFYQYNPAGTEEGNFCFGYATSKDLIHWQEEKISAVSNEKTFLNGKCAEIFALADSDGNQKWISINEKGEYFVGTVENGRFQAEQPEKMLRYGNSSCVSQILTESKDGRKLCLDWSAMESLHFGFGGQMGVPMELSLEKHNDEYYLSVFPAEELGVLYKNTNRYENIKTDKEKMVIIPLADAAQFIRLKGKFDENAVLDLILFGRKIQIDFSENRISIGKNQAPVFVAEKELDITLLVDRRSVELFADGGKIYLCDSSEESLVDRNLLSLVLSCNMEYSLDFAEIHALEPIWQTSPKIF